MKVNEFKKAEKQISYDKNITDEQVYMLHMMESIFERVIHFE